MARNNEPALRRKTPLLICSIRTEIPYPCIGSSANVFRMSMSRVPWTRSLGLSGIKPSSPWLPGGAYASHTGCQEENRDSLNLGGNSKGDGRSLHFGLSAPPTASQAFVPGVATETSHVL